MELMKKKSRAPCDERPAPTTSGDLVFRLRLAVSGPEFLDPAVRKIENLRRQQQVCLPEAAGLLPFAVVILVAALQGDGW